ncbi:ATP-dependent endonuclease, partial [Citrobacter freundii]
IKTEGNIYKTVFMDVSDDVTERFPLKKLINIKEIKANRHLKEGVLSNVFNKIISFQFSNDTISRSELDESIALINERISGNVGPKSSDISLVLGEIENSSRVDLNLSGNVTYDTIMRGLIKYNFMDGDDYIPEDQFGLGYINLLNIIGEIIHFVDSYENGSHLSRINLLFIEEPEAFMHPQMQEFFIKRIDNAVKKALEIANGSSKEKKTLQCQIAITTHSSHIVNSKIHSSNTFNNLNYLTSIDKCTKAVNLTDEALVSSEDSNADKKLNFIKKHIKHKVSELFFSDAII